MPSAKGLIELTVTEERYPPYAAAHGMPDAMVRRVLTVRLAEGAATCEQTDYGHAGRFNACEPRASTRRRSPVPTSCAASSTRSRRCSD
jgi:hypothetical protein